uniref:Glycosyltransferase n=1 Tax=viral metagenome TaxID=1070528 RepID=A0A6C0KVJ1_9ZZZZ
MKAALCFIISYKQILNKEKIWKEWIEPNKDIINIYFHYKNYNNIKSEWIKSHCISPHLCMPTSYYYVVPAYMSILYYAVKQDAENQWFCLLTESCVPIISPEKFRELFFENSNKSIMKNNYVHWNVEYKKQANLRLLTPEFHLKNEPWFVLKREDALACFKYIKINGKIYNIICNGVIANESIFAIILKSQGLLENVINESTHASDWVRRVTPTSPYLFKGGTNGDIAFIKDFLLKNKYTMFLRKVDPLFPDEILKKFIS